MVFADASLCYLYCFIVCILFLRAEIALWKGLV